MKANLEWEICDVEVDREIEVDDDNYQQLNLYIETWFDVDKKFGLNINDEDGTWLNIWGIYNPFEDSLRLECQISRGDGNDEYFDYVPTFGEAKLIKDKVAACIKNRHDKTPQEFCEQYMDEPESVPTQGGPT